MESTRIGIGERKKYTKAAYKKAGGGTEWKKTVSDQKEESAENCPELSVSCPLLVWALCGCADSRPYFGSCISQ